MKKILLLIFLAISFYTQAQNYNCLQPGIKPFFTNGNGYLRGMRIDSVRASGSDTIFYPYHTPRGNYYFNTLDSTGGSWLGKNVIKQADGTFLFDNMWFDTVVIKTQAQLGDTWIFYEDTTKFAYRATVTSVDTMTISGYLDSVKKITIEADASGIINLSDPVNNFQILLSKNNGFVQIFDLYTFPYRIPADTIIVMHGNDYYMDLVLGDLVCGCDNVNPNNPDTINSVFHLVPFYNPAMKELYNFSVGEVLEFGGQSSYYAGNHIATNIRLDTVLSKTTAAGSVTYTFAEREGTINTITYPSSSTTISGAYNASVTAVYDTSRLVDLTYIPEEWNAPDFYHFFPKNNYDSVTVCPDTVWVIDENNINYSTSSIIWGTSIDLGGLSIIGNNTSTYSVGFGLSGINYNNYATTITTTQAGYIYIGNHGAECGAYIEPPLSVNQLNAVTNQIDIFPNPANDVLNINASASISQVAITNLLGQAVYTHSEYSGNKMQVDISALPAGIYLVKINNTDVRKFVKE